MTITSTTMPAIRRRSVLAAAGLALMLSASPAAMAQDVSGDLVILQWQGGTDAEMSKEPARAAGRGHGHGCCIGA